MRSVVLLVLASALLAGCAGGYKLVPPAATPVASGTLVVTPSVAWNRAPRADGATEWEETWTQNGPLLDSVRFVDGLPDGKDLIKQARKAESKVPTFRANMSPQDLVSMMESYYRVAGNVRTFKVTTVAPTRFLNQNAIRLDYEYAAGEAGTGEQRYRGSSVLAVVSGKLYLIALDANASHYYDAARAEFETLVASATLK
jgi:hypothetical protein